MHDRPSFFTLTDPIKKDLSTLINFNCLNTYWSSQIFCYLTLSVLEKLKNLIFEMPIITSIASITLEPLEACWIFFKKYFGQRQCLIVPFLRYCYPKVGRYCDPPSWVQGAKGLRVVSLTNMRSFSIYLAYLKKSENNAKARRKIQQN